MKDIVNRIQTRIQASTIRCGRLPESVKLIAVSKTVTIDQMKRALQAGLHTFGENYIQEARQKVAALSGNQIEWHFIGHLQSNKAPFAAKLFDWIHSVDSFKLAQALNKAAYRQNKIQKILIQVNIAQETTKSGTTRTEIFDLINKASELENLSVRGLMTMPPFFDNPEKARPFFAQLAELRNEIKGLKLDNVHMEELSMGMTGDFEAAIEEGATFVRIGTAIFGKRK